MSRDSEVIDAVFAGWPDAAEAVGESVIRDLVTGEHSLDAKHEGQRFDLKSTLEVLAAAAGFVAAAWEIIDRLRPTRKTLSAAEVLEALSPDLAQALDSDAKRAAIDHLLAQRHD